MYCNNAHPPRGQRVPRDTPHGNVTEVESSHGRDQPRARWIQPVSTIVSILLMFGLIMTAVACNVWCLDGDDDEVSLRGDSTLDVEMAVCQDMEASDT